MRRPKPLDSTPLFLIGGIFLNTLLKGLLPEFWYALLLGTVMGLAGLYVLRDAIRTIHARQTIFTRWPKQQAQVIEHRIDYNFKARHRWSGLVPMRWLVTVVLPDGRKAQYDADLGVLMGKINSRRAQQPELINLEQQREHLLGIVQEYLPTGTAVMVRIHPHGQRSPQGDLMAQGETIMLNGTNPGVPLVQMIVALTATIFGLVTLWPLLHS